MDVHGPWWSRSLFRPRISPFPQKKLPSPPGCHRSCRTGPPLSDFPTICNIWYIYIYIVCVYIYIRSMCICIYIYICAPELRGFSMIWRGNQGPMWTKSHDLSHMVCPNKNMGDATPQLKAIFVRKNDDHPWEGTTSFKGLGWTQKWDLNGSESSQNIWFSTNHLNPTWEWIGVFWTRIQEYGNEWKWRPFCRMSDPLWAFVNTLLPRAGSWIPCTQQSTHKTHKTSTS